MEKLNLKGQKIAYFSMELGISKDIPTYCGGLGIVAADTIKSCAEMNIPLVAVTLIYKKGYFRQELDEKGNQTEQYLDWDPSAIMDLLPLEIILQIENRDVKVKTWLYNFRSIMGGTIPILFLDTDVEGNDPEDRFLTSFLYGGDKKYRLKQEMILGIGGVRILDTLGFRIRKYHMNEGHSSLLTLELMNKHEINVEKVRELCIFTTHTPVKAGHDIFSYKIVEEIITSTNQTDILKQFGGQKELNMTSLALNLSNYVNGVAKKHGETSNKMFPGYEIHAITNGIHSYTWTCDSFRKIFDKHLSGWANEPNLLVRVDVIPDEEVWQAHQEAKHNLIDYINKQVKANFNYDTLTLGFARRATGYKRANLLFSDIEKLKRLNKKGEIQIVFSGKAHPKDLYGKEMIKQIYSVKKQLEGHIRLAYLPDYNLDIAAKMVSGVDVWLNTPLRTREASGTSGMKAAHNGVINFSVLDGWWIEGWIEDITGWAIGPHPEVNITECEIFKQEIDDLYNKLDYIIIPMFYQKRDEWIKRMKNSIGKIAYYFNSHRMMHRYVTEAYF